MSLGPDGYDMIYRNPAAGGLAFASEHRSLPVGDAIGRFNCPAAYQSAFITEDELNLKYALVTDNGNDVFWARDCAQLPDVPPLVKPFTLFSDEIGTKDGFLSEVVDGLILRNGRPPLRLQAQVCVPNGTDLNNPARDPCDPSNFTSQVTDRTPVIATPPHVGAAPTSVVQFATVAEAKAACPALVLAAK